MLSYAINAFKAPILKVIKKKGRTDRKGEELKGKGKWRATSCARTKIPNTSCVVSTAISRSPRIQYQMVPVRRSEAVDQGVPRAGGRDACMLDIGDVE